MKLLCVRKVYHHEDFGYVAGFHDFAGVFDIWRGQLAASFWVRVNEADELNAVFCPVSNDSVEGVDIWCVGAALSPACAIVVEGGYGVRVIDTDSENAARFGQI